MLSNVLILFLLLSTSILAVDRTKFRTCASTNFCHSYLRSAPQNPSSVPLSVTCLTSGSIRIRSAPPHRWESTDVLVNTTETSCDSFPIRFERSGEKIRFFRRQETEPFFVLNDLSLTFVEENGGMVKEMVEKVVKGGEMVGKMVEDVVKDDRLVLDWGEDGKAVYATNDVMEIKESESLPPTNSRTDPETFGGFSDSKPKGPTAVGFDGTFLSKSNKGVGLFGLPEHAVQFSLKDTNGINGAFSEPYRLYNLDVFEYELNEPMALYGNVPYLLARDSTDGTFAGIFFNNPSETFVDLSTGTTSEGKATRLSRWVSETGVIDLFVFAGPTMPQVLDAYTKLTGRPYLPPMYSLAYHQCRWNYRDQKDVEEIHEKFEQLDFPLDVVWLDIEHTDGKRYFTWDKAKFPDPIQMQNDLKRTGRRMVTIVDPHVKRDSAYHVHAEAEKLGYYVKDGTADFDGWCWPGSSSYPDFTSPTVRAWWGDFFTKYDGATDRLSIWNDMNEPSVFNGPEVSMKKTILNIQGVEHRDWHNLYGYYYHQATHEGLRKARPDARPFVLTRSFYAGTQKWGAIWNGDNRADWTHLRISAPMLLSMSVAGLPFVGADVGGFFGNPDVELLVRWYESGSMQPFFRAHAHIETKRREPWLFGEEVLQQIRNVVIERYRILPYLYTAFEESSRTGMPVMRPVFGMQGVAMEDAWLLGSDLFVKPVLNQGENKIDIKDVPGDGFDYIDVNTGRVLKIGDSFDAPLGRTPVFHRVGSIVPKQMRLRRSSELMIKDPYTLYVAVPSDGGGVAAVGRLYLDDQTSMAFSRGERTTIEFTFQCGANKCVLSGRRVGDGLWSPAVSSKIERVVIAATSPRAGAVRSILCDGLKTGSAVQGEGQSTKFEVLCEDDHHIVLRKPWVDVDQPFELVVGG